MTQHWLKGLTKKELDELRKLKKRRWPWWLQIVEDSNYFALTLTLVVFSVLFAQVLILEDQLPSLQRNEAALFDEVGNEVRVITNVGSNLVKDFDELEVYSFDCENFSSDSIFGEPGTHMPYFCALTGYKSNLRGTGQKFEKTLSGIIYYYHLHHEIAVKEMDKEVASLKERADNFPDRDDLLEKWQDKRDENIEKDRKIESFLTALMLSLKDRIEKYELSQTYFELTQKFLLLSILSGFIWGAMRTAKTRQTGR